MLTVSGSPSPFSLGSTVCSIASTVTSSPAFALALAWHCWANAGEENAHIEQVITADHRTEATCSKRISPSFGVNFAHLRTPGGERSEQLSGKCPFILQILVEYRHNKALRVKPGSFFQKFVFVRREFPDTECQENRTHLVDVGERQQIGDGDVVFASF